MREPGAPTRLTVVLCLGVGSGILLDCRRGDDEIARLVDLTGAATRDFAAHPHEWKPAAVDAVFSIGDGVRTGTEAKAKIRFLRGGALQLGSGTEIRFLRGGKAGAPPRLAVETGDAEIEAGDEALSFDTSFGKLVIERGSTTELSIDRDRLRFRVRMGTAVIEGDGGSAAAKAGETIVVDVGGAILEKVGASDTSPPPSLSSPSDAGPSSDAAAPLPSPLAGASFSPELPSATRVEVTVDAGESAVIHDVFAPTGVRIRTGALCPAQALVDLARGGGRYRRAPVADASSGTTTLLPAGAHRYRVRCLDEDKLREPAAATGTLRVVKDSGAAKVARTAPRNLIDADGRSYRVLYQSLLPELKFNWPAAPAAAKFKLHVLPARGEDIVAGADHPVYAFKSGALEEGAYSFWFETDDSLRASSPKSQLRIDFDNAAPAAEIQSPPSGPGHLGGDGTVVIAGIALEGATVSVDGKPLALDRQQRFREEVPLEGRTSLAIRIAHKALGIHYYVRRLAE